MQEMKVPEGAPLIAAVGQHPKQVSGAQIMNELDTIIVKQKADYLEAMTGLQFENKYKVCAYKPTSEFDGEIGKELFKCKEKSDCYKRYCLPANCRPYEVGVYTREPDDRSFLRFEREYACTFYCCNRPEIKVYHAEGTGQYSSGKIPKSPSDTYLGKVTDPFDCCGLGFRVLDDQNKEIYQIYGKCCQCGLCCRCPCSDCCKKVTFDIFDARKEICGKIENIWAGCVQEVLTNADNFIAHLPTSASWKEKSLLLAAVLFIDFQNFEKKKNNNNNRRH